MFQEHNQKHLQTKSATNQPLRNFKINFQKNTNSVARDAQEIEIHALCSFDSANTYKANESSGSKNEQDGRWELVCEAESVAEYFSSFTEDVLRIVPSLPLLHVFFIYIFTCDSKFSREIFKLVATKIKSF